MRKILISLLMSLFVIFCSTAAFAQDEIAPQEDAVAAQENVQADPAPQPVITRADASAAQPVASEPYDWQSDSKLYKGLGWGFFGVGLAAAIAGPIIVVAGGTSNALEEDTKGVAGSTIAGISVAILGSAMVTTGIILLIVEAVKFNPYRRGEISDSGFTWHPEFYASPEFSGIGISGRF